MTDQAHCRRLPAFGREQGQSSLATRQATASTANLPSPQIPLQWITTYQLRAGAEHGERGEKVAHLFIRQSVFGGVFYAETDPLARTRAAVGVHARHVFGCGLREQGRGIGVDNPLS